MDQTMLVERAKMYLKMLSDGVHPVTGRAIPEDSAFVDEKVKRCFSFISQILDDYVVLSEKVAMLEEEREKATVVVPKKLKFAITEAQCNSIKLSKEPLTVLSFMRNVNSVIDPASMEKLTSGRLNKWLCKRGLIKTEKVQEVVNKTVYKPSDLATRIGIVEEEVVDKKSGEVKSQIKLGETAQLFIIENLEQIISMT